MEFWKALIILKEINKPSDKFLRVWAKNQLRFENFEEILKFTCKNLNGKLIFYPFSLPKEKLRDRILSTFPFVKFSAFSLSTGRIEFSS